MKAAALALALLAGLLVAGCTSTKRSAPRPGLTYIGKEPVVLDAQVIGNVLVVEAKWDKYGPYHFIVDTGSAVTLVSPDVAARYAIADSPAFDEPQIKVKAPDGGSVLLRPATLKMIQLGKTRFEYVPALVYDCADVSSQFGMQIDGILGFPLFRNVLLTLDYGHQKVILRKEIPQEGLPGEAILFTNRDKIPLVAVRLDGKEFAALVDSGSSEALGLNTTGLDARFASGPTEGPVVSTLAGDRVSRVGRLDGVLRIGSFDIANPVASVTDELSWIGGGILSHFTITFDQEHDQAILQHDASEDIATGPLRGTGLSFHKTPAYWKVVGVIRDSPAGRLGVSPGDLISRINGEPVENFSPERYERLMRQSEAVEYTFIDGTQESRKVVAVASLVP
jgi:Aspartyl protease/PDZ domain